MDPVYPDFMDRRQLQYFVAVCDHDGFTRAADALDISQPTLSQAISALERSLGLRLFDRVGRRVRLSSAGRALLEPARRTLRDFTVAEQSVARVRGLVAGHLDVAAIPTLVQPLAVLVGRFRREHPDVVVRSPELEIGSGVEAAVSAGVCELGLTELPAGAADLISIGMGEQPFQLVLPPDVDPGVGRGGRVSLANLGRFDFVATPLGTSSRSRLEEALRHAQKQPRVCVETGHRDSLIPLVLAHAGAAFLPEPMAAQARRLGARVLDTEPVVSRGYGLIHRSAPLSPAAQAFVGCVARVA